MAPEISWVVGAWAISRGSLKPVDLLSMKVVPCGVDHKGDTWLSGCARVVREVLKMLGSMHSHTCDVDKAGYVHGRELE